MATYVKTTEQFIDELKGLFEKYDPKKEKVVVSTTSLDGNQMAPSKKNPTFRISMGIAKQAFAHEDLRVVMDGYPLLLVLVDRTMLSKDAIEIIEKHGGEKI